MAIKVYTNKFNTSPPARAVQMLLETLQVPYELVEIDIFAGENRTEGFLKLNPLHTVPVIEDGDFTLYESHAILTYLVGKYAKDDSLLPKDLKKRAVVDQRLHLDSGLIFPTLLSCVMTVLVQKKDSYKEEDVNKLRELCDVVEQILIDKPWIAGDQLTVADYSLASSFSALVVVLPIQGKYPKIEQWYNKFTKFPFFDKVSARGIAALEQKLGPYKIQ